MMEGFTVTPLGSADSPFLQQAHPDEIQRGAVMMEDTADHLKALQRQELAYPPCKDYLSATDAASPSDAVNEGWRRKLCEWCYEVVDHFSFDREAVSIALNYLDRSVAVRSVSSSTPIAKREFQLLAVTSLYMALKIHGESEESEGPRRKLRIDAFVELSRGFFQVEVIESMERGILDSLDFRVNPPTCVKFIAGYLKLFPKWTVAEFNHPHGSVIGGTYDVARYLCELSVCVSPFSFTCKTSIIAYAAILCSFEALQTTVPPPYQARVIFQNNMAEATGLLPNDPEVLRVREMLKDLCPNMFDGETYSPGYLLDRENSYSSLNQDLESGGEDGKTSPVCVVDSQNDTPRSRRKRSRSFDEPSAAAGTSPSH